MRITDKIFRSGTRLAAAAWLSLLLNAGAQAAEVQIDYRPCDDRLSVRAEEQPLSRVISSLAEELDFKLRFNLESERTISVDTEGTAAEVLRKITRNTNVMISEAKNEACPGHTRIVQVRFLGTGPKVTEEELAARYEAVERTAEIDWNWEVAENGSDSGEADAQPAKPARPAIDPAADKAFSEAFGTKPQSTQAFEEIFGKPQSETFEEIFGSGQQGEDGGFLGPGTSDSGSLDDLFGTQPGTFPERETPPEDLFGDPEPPPGK